MAVTSDTTSMALFCDFENVALGVRDAKYEKFDIKLVLERLLLKGSIVVKKAYCDWERYKGFKAGMHEANFELIEIPHVRQSGKNSADIRLVVDALDLCYTKSHVNTFVIISGDSDFSPLVSKLRENAKQVIGVGVKQSTSDLLIANCDEFIFYDDLVRETQRVVARREPKDAQPARRADDDKPRREDVDARRAKGIEIAVQTLEALTAERGDTGKIWASVLKEAIKRRKPDFGETRYGFRTFGGLLEEAQARGLLEFGRDEKSGAYVNRVMSSRLDVPVDVPAQEGSPAEMPAEPVEARADGKPEGRRKRGGKKGAKDAGRDAPRAEAAAATAEAAEAVPTPQAEEVVEAAVVPVSVEPEPAVAAEAVAKPARRKRASAKSAKAGAATPEAAPATVEPASADTAPTKPARRKRGGTASAKADAVAPDVSAPADAAPAPPRRGRKGEA